MFSEFCRLLEVLLIYAPPMKGSHLGGGVSINDREVPQMFGEGVMQGSREGIGDGKPARFHRCLLE